MTLQVFTTVFLAQTHRASPGAVDDPDSVDQNSSGAIEFRQNLRECVSKLESRGFFAWDDPEQD
jgi:hypothetical protein